MADGTIAARRKRARKEHAPTTPDPIEIAMEAEAAGGAASGQASLLLEAQRRLIGWEIADRRAAFSLKALTALAGAGAAVAVALMAWTASRAEGVVIDGLSAPADLQSRGLTPTALATALQDRLGQMEAETASPNQAARLRDRPLSNVRVEIPSTGVSIDDANQLLRGWLGKETHVTGELTYMPGGPYRGALALSIRVGDRPGHRFLAPDGDLDPLLTQAAEHVTRSLTPLRYAAWLDQHGRSPEAIAILRDASHRGSAESKAAALNRLAQVIGIAQRPEARLALNMRARDLDPRAAGYMDSAADLLRRGHWEEARRGWEIARRQGAPPESTAFGRNQWAALSASGLGQLYGNPQDQAALGCFHYSVTPCSPAALADAMEAADGAPNGDGQQAVRITNYVGGAVAAHELTVAERILTTRQPNATGRSEMYRASVESSRIRAAADIALEREDWAQVVQLADAWDALAEQWPGLHLPSLQVSRAWALARLGDRAGAEAAIGDTPLDCYPCVRMRGRIAALAGDRARSDHWFGEAVKMAPVLPMAELDWGRALLAQGRAGAAVEKLRVASRKSPKSPDAAALWGEALLAQGDAEGAASKFATAEPLAPRWGRLHLKWGEALAAQGKPAEAHRQWRVAAGMDLTPTERAQLAAVSTKRTN
jgi:tetratricopeptide (TPR) repeat protein